MPTISIIIPIYNVEEFLPQCLDSIIHQTYQNLEIILVNDGSTDTCPKICENYATKDARIKVVNIENSGSAEARNVGLNYATGELISFLDSDDYLALNFYDSLCEVLLHEKADIVACNFIAFKNLDEIKKLDTSAKATLEIYNTEKALQLLMKEQLKQVVWNKLYRKEVIENIHFPTGKTIDDEFWTYQVFGNAKKIVKISDVLYFYRQQSESIMGRKYSLKRLDGLQALEERIQYMKTNFPNLVNLAIEKFCMGSIFHYQQIENRKDIDSHKIFRDRIFHNIKTYNRFQNYNSWNWKDIFWFKLFALSPTLCILLRNFNEKRIENRSLKQVVNNS